MADILVLVIIADAAQNGMSGEYKSVTEGAILVATIVAWNLLTDWLTYRVPRLQKVLEPPPLLLIDNGRLLRRNLRLEFVSEDELAPSCASTASATTPRSPRPTWRATARSA